MRHLAVSLYHTSRRAEEEDALKRADWITKAGAVSNVGLAGLKAGAGVAANSPAMIADAAHSLSDLLSDAVSLWALRAARVPADTDHPYGHGKFEAVGSACVGGLLLAAGGGIGVHAASAALASEPLGTLTAQLGAAAAAVLSLAVKEILFRATLRVGQEVRSTTLMANAWHHRSDALSSAIALAGILGSMGGVGHVGFLDPVAGVLVSGMIVREGVKVLHQAVRELTDSQVDEELLASVESAARAVAEVRHVSQLRGRVLGPYTLVDLRVSVDPTMSASIAHQVAVKVEMAVRSQVAEVTEVLVHLEAAERRRDLEAGGVSRPLWTVPASSQRAADLPDDGRDEQPGHMKLMRPQAEIEGEVRSTLSTVTGVWGCSHIHLFWDAARGGTLVHVDLVMDPRIRVLQAMRIGATAKQALETLEDVLEADVHLELMLPCSSMDSRELLPPEWALPEVSPEGTSKGSGSR